MFAFCWVCNEEGEVGWLGMGWDGVIVQDYPCSVCWVGTFEFGMQLVCEIDGDLRGRGIEGMGEDEMAIVSYYSTWFSPAT